MSRVGGNAMASDAGDPVQSVDRNTLLELATPDLYRGNPFRVLGLPVTATPRPP